MAVTAYIMRQDAFLLLKRTNPPLVWGPPGGRLELHEEPLSGMKREVLEETGLRVRSRGIVDTWFGTVVGIGQLLSINYLCCISSGQLRLSEEHSDFRWLTLAQLGSSHSTYLADKDGFQLSDFEKVAHFSRFPDSPSY